MMTWIVEALVASTLLIVLVMAVRGPVARHFGARAAYALWALPALRFLMPTLPGWGGFYVPVWRVGPAQTMIGLASPVEAATLLADVPPAPPAPPAPLPPLPVAHAIDWPFLLLALWAAGALAWFAWQMLGYRLFLARALRGASHLTRECGVDVWLTPAVGGPVAAGILRRRIFLPLDFMTRYAPAERRLALLHEGAHHDRRDILANLVALAVLALHWFNPLAHRAYRLFRADQELACDETVLAELGAGERHAYGSAVVKAAGARMPGVACALGHRAELKHRLRTMARPMPGRGRSRAGLGLAILAAAGGLALTAPGATTPPREDAAMYGPSDTNGADANDMAEARRDAEEARREAAQDRIEAARDAAAARRDAEQDRRDAARDRAEALREAKQARAEGMREAEQAHGEALREAARARAEAARDAEQARRDVEQGRRDAEQARREAARAHDNADEGARQIAAVRQSMAAKCAARGRPVSADLSWERLALCGDTGAAIAARINAQVHAHLAAARID